MCQTSHGYYLHACGPIALFTILCTMLTPRVATICMLERSYGHEQVYDPANDF
ncbi:hypothetical protein BJX76DRAFT_320406 [Aspergillus varians]